MKLKAFCVKDALTGFTTPDFKMSEAVALRDFAYVVNNQAGLLQSKPEDYSLYLIGEFDTEKGTFKALDKKLIAEAVSVINREVK